MITNYLDYQARSDNLTICSYSFRDNLYLLLYLSNIGVRVKKDFGIHGVFSGEIVGFQKPYYQVVYSDEDKEDYRFTDVLKLIDLDFFNGDHDEGEGEEEDEDEEKRGMEASSGDEGGNVAVDRAVQDKEPEEQEEQEQDAGMGMGAMPPGAPPAPAMMACSPLACAFSAYWNISSGIRCAERTWAS